MNIYMQICGLILILFLLALFKSHKTLGLPGEKTFLRILYFTIINLTLDALSVVAIHFRASLPQILVNISCKAYIISMFWLAWVDFSYVMLDLNRDRKVRKRMINILIAVSLVETAITAFLPIGIHDEADGVYTYGPAVTAVYGFTLFYIVSTLIVSIFIMKKKNSRRGMAVMMTTGLWIIAAAVQFINNELLVVGFSCAVGVMTLYIVMENPDAYFDRNLGCFNSYALTEYLELRMISGEPFGMLDFSITDIRALEEKGIDVQGTTKKIIAQIERDHDLFLFKNFSYGLVVVSRDDEKLSNISNQLLKLLSAYRDAAGDIMIFTVHNAQQFETANEALKFLTYIRTNTSDRYSTVFHVSEDMINSYKQVKQTERDIAEALEEDRVEVFYQPICGQGGNDVICAEALVRIRKPDGGLLSPGVFIPVAEATGQIKELGERVLEKVCRFLRDSDAVTLGLKTVDVNLSAIQCDDHTMASRLSKIVEGYGVDPELIIFEITETAVSTAREILVDNMNALISRGFSFALDDFGKGESNLIYLIEMPARILKLDIDMSKAYFSNPKAKHVVKAIVTMAHNLDLSIVVEGIENSDEADGINREGIDYIQGYYYSRPLPENDFISYLESRKPAAV